MAATTSTSVALLVFFGSLLLSIMASMVLAERLDQVGERFRVPAGLLGLITALGADSPEIASAVSALIAGEHDLGRGVIFGSNVFNVAFLLGFSALVAGRVTIGRANLALNGGVALGVTLVIGVEAAGFISPLASGLLLAALMLPYIAVLSMRPDQLARLPLPGPLKRLLAAAARSETHDTSAEEQEGELDSSAGRMMTWTDGIAILPMLAVIVVGSIAMVEAATILGSRWHVSPIIIGTFVVATLTGIPNLIASIGLAAKGRGAALSSEAFNSNSLNLLAGIYLPSLLVVQPPASRAGLAAIAWLVGITVVALALGGLRRGFGRLGGGLLLVAYAGFVWSVVG